VDISNQLFQIGVFLANDRFVSVLKKLPMASVPPVIGYRIACEQSSHQIGNTPRPTTKQEMGVVGQIRPCVALGLGFGQENRQPFDEVFAILIITEYLTAFNPADHYMMQKAGRIQSCCSRHADKVPAKELYVKLF